MPCPCRIPIVPIPFIVVLRHPLPMSCPMRLLPIMLRLLPIMPRLLPIMLRLVPLASGCDRLTVPDAFIESRQMAVALNTGVFFLRSNNWTLAMMDQ